MEKKKEKGITLVSLIITIIVLLILAVVSIRLIINDGVLIKAEAGVNVYAEEEMKEKIQLAQSEYRMGKLDNESYTLEQALENAGITNVTVTGNDEKGYVIALENGNKYEVTSDGTVKEPIPVGSYVQYNVTYKDMYSGIKYTANNGWRYLGKDDNGNNLIVSTGIPAILYYHYNSNIGNIADGGANEWWATKAEISTTTDTLYRTDKGYNYNTDSGEPNKYAAYGLRYKFESIPFTYKESETSVGIANTGIFRQVGNQTSGTKINLNFKAEGIDVIDVHNLTLAELNRATNSASGSSRADTDTSSGFKDLTGTALGLFNMGKLENYGTTTNYYYWLASPYANGRNNFYIVDFRDGAVLYGYIWNSNGVRPVVTLPSSVNLTVMNN